MRITFFSNFFNFHQLPLANEFQAMNDVEYTFVSLLSTEGMVGRTSLDNEYSFVLREYEGETSAGLAMKHAVEDEIVVFGDMTSKEQYVRARAETGKPFFRYAERLLKRGDWWRFVPVKAYRTWDRFGRYKNCDMRVLCASAYTARDLGLFGFPESMCLKWGYFPQVEGRAGLAVYKTSLPRYKALCSAQRLIPLKRVDLQIHALQRIALTEPNVRLTIAGDGPERKKLENLAVELGVSGNVAFLGECSHDDVLDLMCESGIFLATSDRHEGWGATINEAMSMGCCIIASEEMGSVPYLIKDGTNGLSFRRGDFVVASDKISQALSDADFARRLGAEAKKTVDGTWSAKEAAVRFAELAKYVSYGKGTDFAGFRPWPDGPLSSAGV